MKSIGLMGIMGLLICGCNKSDVKIRDAAVKEIAENMGKAESERFYNESLEIALEHASNCRKVLENAVGQAEVALAAEDLRMANEDIRKIQRDIEKLD